MMFGAFIPPFQGGVSRGSVRVGVVKTFLLPSYGFSFGYKRKGVSIAEVTEARRNIVGQKMRANAIIGHGYNPSVSFADSSPYTGEPRSALSRATVMRTKILSVTPVNPLGVTAPLTCKGSRGSRSVYRSAKWRAEAVPAAGRRAARGLCGGKRFLRLIYP